MSFVVLFVSAQSAQRSSLRAQMFVASVLLYQAASEVAYRDKRNWLHKCSNQTLIGQAEVHNVSRQCPHDFLFLN